MGGNGEGQAHVHAAGVAFDGGVQELLDLGKGDDLVELAVDLAAAHAQDGAVKIDVVAAGELGVEAGADLQQGGDAAVDVGVAGGGLGDAGEDFEEGALTGAITADDADDFALLHLKRHILERPKIGRGLRISDWGFGMAPAPIRNSQSQIRNSIPQGVVALLGGADAVELGQVFDAEGDVGHQWGTG